jgi:hypothetical protein
MTLAPTPATAATLGWPRNAPRRSPYVKAGYLSFWPPTILASTAVAFVAAITIAVPARAPAQGVQRA